MRTAVACPEEEPDPPVVLNMVNDVTLTGASPAQYLTVNWPSPAVHSFTTGSGFVTIR